MKESQCTGGVVGGGWHPRVCFPMGLVDGL